jgi:hypothetical protein
LLTAQNHFLIVPYRKSRQRNRLCSRLVVF